LNALNSQLLTELSAALDAAEADEAVRCLVLTGSDRAFAAGADIKEMAAMSYTDMVKRSSALTSAFTSVARIPKPVVAAVNGYALGGGCELALCADVRIVAEDATLGQPEILLGIIPGAGGTQRLPRLVGPSRAKDLVFSGRFVAADEALRIGLVDEVVAPDDVYAAALDRVRRYVGGPAYALRAAKEAIDRGLETDLDTGLEIERMQFSALFATRDRATGRASIVEDGPGKASIEGR
jgi:enoyl-CoA hydratase/carnithine racemase